MMICQQVTSRAQQNLDFVAELFDDITASRVLEELKLGVVGGSEDLQVSPTDGDLGRPRKKSRILAPLSTLSVRSRASTYNLADFSFPSLQEILHTSNPNYASKSARPRSANALPIPQISLTRRGRVSLRASTKAGLKASPSCSETITYGFPRSHFIPPDKMMMEEEGRQGLVGSSHQHGQIPSSDGTSDSNFGWFVDLDQHRHGEELNRGTKTYPRQVSLSSPYEHWSMDVLAYSAPIAPSYRSDVDVELEWAMAVDTIDSIFAGANCDGIARKG
jgi:hypothetical protein